MSELQPYETNPFLLLSSYTDAFLQEFKLIPLEGKGSSTHGKSLVMLLLFLFIIWATVHWHLGYMNFILMCVPLGIVATLFYTERELSKEE